MWIIILSRYKKYWHKNPIKKYKIIKQCSYLKTWIIISTKYKKYWQNKKIFLNKCGYKTNLFKKIKFNF